MDSTYAGKLMNLRVGCPSFSQWKCLVNLDSQCDGSVDGAEDLWRGGSLNSSFGLYVSEHNWRKTGLPNRAECPFEN